MPCREGEYEWTATVYNVNEGNNKDLMNKCKILREYATMVSKIREFQQKTYDLEINTLDDIFHNTRFGRYVKYSLKYMLYL